MGTEIDGVNGIIKNTTSDGDVTIKGNDGGSEISALVLDMSDAGTATFNHDVKLGDNSKAIFGAGSDLNIFHDGSHSYIQDSGTGDLRIRGSAAIKFEDNNGSETFAIFNDDGAVELYHNNVKKLETSAAGISVTGTGTFTTADNTDTLTLISTDADANVGPVLNLYRNSSSPADDDDAGRIHFTGNDSGGNATTYATIRTVINDVTDGTEDVQVLHKQLIGGTEVNTIRIKPDEIVLNDSSIDLDFRVESNGNTHMIFVDAGANHVNIGQAGDSEHTLNVAGNGFFTTADNTDTLTLECTDADANNGPVLCLHRNSGSPADNDVIGRIDFSGESDAGSEQNFAVMKVFAEAVAHGSETGQFSLYTRLAGSEIERIGCGSAATVINDGSANIDFRVESNDLTHAIYLNSARNELVIGSNTDYGGRFAVDETRADHRVANFEGNTSSYAETAVNFAVPKNATDFNFFKCEARGFANKLTVRGDGNVTNTNNSYGQISDERLKSNIVDANSQWDDIKALKVRNFKKADTGDLIQIGVISQELEEAGMNGLVTETEADEYQIAYVDDESVLKEGDNIKEVKYSVLYMKSIKALQEAMTRIETLETKVAALEG